MTLDRLLADGIRRSRAGGRLLLLGLATPLLVVALACGSDDDDEETANAAAAVAAAGGGVTTVTPTPPSTTAPDVAREDLAVAVWGEQACALTRSFATDFLASGDTRDPETLSLDERKERAEVMFPVQIDSVNAALGRLDLIKAPERTAELHALLRQTFEELLRALGDQRVIIEAATSTDEITFSNLEVNELVDLAFRQGSLLQNAGYC